MSTPDINQILSQARTIAVVGCSVQPWRASHQIAHYLQQAGYRIIPVNPHYPEILGETCYPNVQAIPTDLHLDIINIFRRAEFSVQVVEDTLERIAHTQENPVIWPQHGASSEAARQKAEAAGLCYVADQCIRIAHMFLKWSEDQTESPVTP